LKHYGHYNIDFTFVFLQIDVKNSAAAHRVSVSDKLFLIWSNGSF